MRTVIQQDGIHFNLSQKIVADSRSATGDVNVMTHAHMDHVLHQDCDTVLCSETTAALAEARTGGAVSFNDTHKAIELLPAGHIIGSRAARIRENDTTYLYTGDVSTRDRCYLDGFDPVSADVLIVESTYGIPAYTFPDQQELEARITDWIAGSADTPLFLFGYSLGRAQKLQHIIQDATNRPIIAHRAIHNMNEAVADATDLSFRAEPYAEHKENLPDDGIVLLPPQLSRRDWVTDLVDRMEGMTAGFSGWAATDTYRHRGGYDVTFPLSDHCDFTELVELVQAVNPETVYTHHGFDEAFASFLRSDYGFDARPLKEGQTSLQDF